MKPVRHAQLAASGCEALGVCTMASRCEWEGLRLSTVRGWWLDAMGSALGVAFLVSSGGAAQASQRLATEAIPLTTARTAHKDRVIAIVATD